MTRYEVRDARGDLQAVHTRQDLPGGGKQMRWQGGFDHSLTHNTEPRAAGLSVSATPTRFLPSPSAPRNHGCVTDNGSRCSSLS